MLMKYFILGSLNKNFDLHLHLQSYNTSLKETRENFLEFLGLIDIFHVPSTCSKYERKFS